MIIGLVCFGSFGSPSLQEYIGAMATPMLFIVLVVLYYYKKKAEDTAPVPTPTAEVGYCMMQGYASGPG